MTGITSRASLYRHLLRQCNKLPANVQEYYKHYWRQQLNQHDDETDGGDRMQGIIDQSIKDMQWIIHKYSKETDDGTKK